MTEEEVAKLHDDVLVLQTNVKGIEVAFVDFRAETRDEIKWLRRWLIASLGTVVVTSIGSSLWAVFRI